MFSTFNLKRKKGGRISPTAGVRLITVPGNRKASVVRSGLQMSRFMPEIYPDARRLAENVLAKLLPEEMYYYHPDDAYHLPRYRQYNNQFLSGDAIANRQWAYRLYNELAKNRS